MTTSNPTHVALLKKSVRQWNEWRLTNPTTKPQLFESDLSNAQLHSADLSSADIRGASLSNANLASANLRGADLYRASAWRADLSDANLEGADLSSVNLNGALLRGTNLRSANLRFASMTAADVSEAVFSEASVYGCSFWNLKGKPKEQLNILITPISEAAITVDNIEVAQFIYLMTKNQKIRSVIDTITSKVVLILGRFSSERLAVLQALRLELRLRNYLPVLFDFEKPLSRDLSETISTLAHMARFVIADITDAKSIPQELTIIVPHLPSVPVQPLLLASQREYGMFEHFRAYPWVLAEYLYDDEPTLLMNVSQRVIAPSERWIEAHRRSRGA
jgi:uncharacterized protein YjbI with pentapeptide repeats